MRPSRELMRHALGRGKAALRDARFALTRESKRRRYLQTNSRPGPVVADQGPRYLFFNPDAGIAPHFAASCIVARSLQELGHPVLFARCFDFFDQCPVMDMNRLIPGGPKKDRTIACFRCVASSERMLGAYELPYVNLRTLWTSELEKILKGAMDSPVDDLREFRFDNIFFGKLTAAMLIIATKVSDINAPSAENRRRWLLLIGDAVKSHLLLQELFRTIPIRGVVIYGDYSLSLPARIFAERLGLPAYTLIQASHRNIDRRRIGFRPTEWRIYSARKIEGWHEWRELPLTPAEVTDQTEDLLVKYRGGKTFSYSPPKEARQPPLHTMLGLSPEKKLLVAYTSSTDEEASRDMILQALGLPHKLPTPTFPDQISWLKAVIKHVSNHPDLQLVIRVHPREGSNQRDSAISEHLRLLREEFSSVPDRCAVVWPETRISSYDLAEIADLVLVSWSTIAGEVARVGVPVLASTSGMGTEVRDDFQEWRSEPDAYFMRLDEKVQSAGSFDSIRRACRWHNLSNLAVTLNFGDLIPFPDFVELPPFRMPAEATRIESVLIRGKDVLDQNLDRVRAMQHAGSADEEADALRRELRRILHFFCAGEDIPGTFHLLIPSSTFSLNPLPVSVHVLFVDGPRIRYCFADQTRERFSPLIARLGGWIAQSTGDDADRIIDTLGEYRLTATSAGVEIEPR